MILLEQNTVNDVFLTLKEKSTLITPEYLFKFVNDITFEEKIFLAANISTATDRYDEFLIELVSSNSENLYSGKIYLKDSGFYHYYVYEQEVSSPQNLDPTLTTTQVECGKVLVNGAVREITYIEYPNTNTDDNYQYLRD